MRLRLLKGRSASQGAALSTILPHGCRVARQRYAGTHSAKGRVCRMPGFDAFVQTDNGEKAPLTAEWKSEWSSASLAAEPRVQIIVIHKAVDLIDWRSNLLALTPSESALMRKAIVGSRKLSEEEKAERLRVLDRERRVLIHKAVAHPDKTQLTMPLHDKPAIVRQTIRPGDPHPTMPHLKPSSPVDLQRAKSRGVVVPPTSWGLHISDDPNAKVQATWHDSKGRKQYGYHQHAIEERDAHKFEAVHHFANALPKIRSQVQEHLKLPGAHPDRVKAAVVHLMDKSGIRVGSEEYAKENETYGASSLRKEHVSLHNGDEVHLHFTGKHNKEQSPIVKDKALHDTIKHLHSLPGERLFQHEEKGKLTPTTERHIRDYLKPHGVTPKQYRTYHATKKAAEHLLSQPHTEDAAQREKHITGAVKHVSEFLGNTPTVARGSYINPAILDAYRKGHLTKESVIKALHPLSERSAHHEINHDQYVTLLQKIEKLLKEQKVSDSGSRKTGRRKKIIRIRKAVSSPCTVYLVSHGESEMNKPKDLITGWKNPPLDADGKKQALALARHLSKLGVKRIVTSDLKRARQTADIIGQELGIKVEANEVYRPQKMGQYEGQTSESVRPKMASYVIDHPDEPIPGGESFNAFAKPFLADLSKLVSSCHETTVLVTHSRNLALAAAAEGGKTDCKKYLEHDVETGAILKLTKAPGGWKSEWITDHTPVRKAIDKRGGPNTTMDLESRELAKPSPSSKPSGSLGQTAFPANHVVHKVVSFDGQHLGVMIHPHNGTKEGILKSAKHLHRMAADQYPGWQGRSETNSMTAATGEHGEAKYAISPNLAHVAKIGSKEAKYIFGDLNSAPTKKAIVIITKAHPHPTLIRIRRT
jgi:DNA topoisomerase I